MPLLNQPGTDSASSFAGLLAALTARPPSSPSPADDLLDGLEDDVATLSYERALRTHGRSKPIGSSGLAHGADDPGAGPVFPAPPGPVPEHPPVSAPTRQGAGEADRKRASVTLRMSRAECARLQGRAAEAGLTVSAYLRFCAFEVEALRAEVKAALSDMRAPQPERGSRWLRLFRPHR